MAIPRTPSTKEFKLGHSTLGALRGSVVKPSEWLTLEVIRDGYEQKRLTGDAEYCLRPGAEKIVIGSAAKKADFTPRQGQFLAFIYYFAKLNGISKSPSPLCIKWSYHWNKRG